jgi:hypothetical protein
MFSFKIYIVFYMVCLTGLAHRSTVFLDRAMSIFFCTYTGHNKLCHASVKKISYSHAHA